MNDLASLQAAVGRGERFKYLFFWGHTGKGEVGPHGLNLLGFALMEARAQLTQ